MYLSMSNINMNVIAAAQAYIQKMIDSAPDAMKVLLLDAHTTPYLSAVSTQSALLAHQVYLVDRIDSALAPKKQEKLGHLKCIVFVRPTPDSLAHLMAELRAPRFGEYHLYFSNVLRKLALEKLAEADQFELVRDVTELFLDYLAINPDLYSLDLPPAAWPVYQGTLNEWNPNTLQRTVDGILSVCLAMKKRPIVRYACNSPLAKRLAHEIGFATGSSGEPGLFDSRSQGLAPATLLLIDRRSDPTTPLLAQWTYQAMVHELIGIEHGLVDLSHVPDIKDDLKQIVLGARDDAFFAAQMNANFGDLGFAIKKYLDEYQQRTASHATLESIADMKKFVDAYPEVRKLAGNVSKHVALTGELSRVVDAYKLLGVSEAEQNVACDPRDQTEAVWAVLRDEGVPDECKLKLVILFALRDPRAAQLPAMVQHLQALGGVGAAKVALVQHLVKFALPDPLSAAGGSGGAGGAGSMSTASVASGEMLLDRTRQLGKSVFRGLKGVENVYTQHVPKLHNVLELLIKGKLKESAFPYVDGQQQAGRRGSRVNDVIVFVIGGTTYEEARFVNQLASATNGLRIVLGGHTVHNSQSFLKQVHDTFAYSVTS
ncbi:Sec1-like protein [Catenaria anguillulae PL171]|uniref:Sec1-like protein n=1 Tax=Catenaria anguillulae PL171 TaxID=765915 RepID=A0A1Y2I2A6_9FUNG|nr:Sec1-like protein [Catenaria anguillulae PL171]